MPTITVAFKKGKLGGVFDHVIDDLTCGPYCHVELMLAGTLEAATCYSSRIGSGVSIQEVDISGDEWDRIDYDVTDMQYGMIEAFCWGASGKPYDYLGLLDAMYGRGPELCPIGRFCSGAVPEPMSYVGLILLPQPIWTISPNRLAWILKGEQT